MDVILDPDPLRILDMDRPEPCKRPKAQKRAPAAKRETPRLNVRHAAATCECAKCSQDRRWNQIYAEKFADPAYYHRDRARIGRSAIAEAAERWGD